MRAIRFKSFGVPHEVCRCVEVADPELPAAGEITVRLAASPINPADVLNITGQYGKRAVLPAIPGAEGIGTISACGADVGELAVGDRVMLPALQNWVEFRNISAGRVVKIPADGDALQLASLRITPPTAHLLLRDMVALPPGDWVIQNAANSAVGREMIRVAHQRKLRTINVVRREGLDDLLRGDGADAVLVDGDDLAARVDEVVGGDPIRLAIDAAGGLPSAHLIECLGPNGLFVNYGMLTGQACLIDPKHLIFKGVTARGFWLSVELERLGWAATVKLYHQLAARVIKGESRVEIAGQYPIEDIQAALQHAQQPGLGGKVILTFG